MKIKQEHFNQIKSAIEPLDTEAVRSNYRAGNFPRSDKVKDLNMRYRWDLFWAAGCSSFLNDMYDDGLKDSHIDTALRKIVKEL